MTLTLIKTTFMSGRRSFTASFSLLEGGELNVVQAPPRKSVPSALSANAFPPTGHGIQTNGQ